LANASLAKAPQYREKIVEIRRQYRIVYLTPEHKRRALECVRNSTDGRGINWVAEQQGEARVVVIDSKTTVAPNLVSDVAPSYSKVKPRTMAGLGSRYYRQHKGPT
jgi:hypothetical protein